MADCGDAKVIDVLLVEDDEGDVLMTREAFEYYKIRNRLHVVPDGDQALDFLRQTGATLETGHLPLVLAELPLLIAVFQNLLSNALKFSGGKPPRVVITVRRDEPFWLFSFSDSGIGIEPEYAERIFVIFQRLNERSAYAGTGIGLAMTRKIIEYFGGRIWLDTTFTGGTRFYFTLPMPQETMTPELLEPVEVADNQKAAALLPAPDWIVAPEDPEDPDPEDRQDEETDGRQR